MLNNPVLIGEPGVGKTLSAISVVEGNKAFLSKPALVLVKGQGVKENFESEILKIRPDYGLDENGEPISKKRLHQAIETTYDIHTFRVFSKEISFYLEQFPERVKEMYSDRVIIIDEVHNLREEDEKESKKRQRDEEARLLVPERQRAKAKEEKLYSVFHKFLHTVENCKIILLSATPIKDKVSEFASIMNLVLPMSKQFSVETFEADYFSGKTLIEGKRNQLMEKTRGYISYLRQLRDDDKLRIIQAGDRINQGKDGLLGFTVVRLAMEKYQSNEYKKAYLSDKKKEPSGRVQLITEGGVYQASRQAILSCYPASKSGVTYGNERSALEVKEKRVIYNDKFYHEIARSILGITRENEKELKIDEKLERLKQYSIKYYYIIQRALEFPKHKMFVYSKYVEGSALFLLSHLLSNVGFTKTDGRKSDSSKHKRHAIITSINSSADIEATLYQFNQVENRFGEQIQILLGSPTIGESKSLLSIREIMILTPHWNYSETEQAIGRGIRYASHHQLPEEERFVTIHRLVALPSQKDVVSIDEYMYHISFEKDLLTKQIEDAAREVAVDCLNNKIRNQLPASFENSRECFYKSCDYKCAITDLKTEFNDTYNLFYTEKEYNMIRDNIQDIFFHQPVFSFTFQKLYSLFYAPIKAFPIHVIFRCLKELIERRHVFTNPNGWPSYLQVQDGFYFLSSFLVIQPTDVYDTIHGPLFPSPSFESFINDLEYQKIPELIRTIQVQPEKMRELQTPLQLAIYKAGVQLSNQPIIDFGIRTKKIKKIGTRYIINHQTFNGISWVDYQVQEEEDEFSKGDIENLAKELVSNPTIKGYGIQGESFRIVFFDKPKSILLGDQKKKGIACSTAGTAVLHPFYQHLFGGVPAKGMTRPMICKQIQDKLSSLSFETAPFLFVLPEAVHMRLKEFYASSEGKKLLGIAD